MRHISTVILDLLLRFLQDALSTVIIMELPLVEPIVRDPASGEIDILSM